MGLKQKVVEAAKAYHYYATGDVLGDMYRDEKVSFLVSLSAFEGASIDAKLFYHYHDFKPKVFDMFVSRLEQEGLVKSRLGEDGNYKYQISFLGVKLINEEANRGTLGVQASKRFINDFPLMALIGGYQHPGIVPNNPLSWAPSDPAIKRLVDKGLARINGRADSVESNLELTRYGHGLLSSQGYTKIDNFEGWDLIIPSNKPLSWIARYNHRRGLARAGEVEIAQRLLVTMFVLAKSKGSARLTPDDLAGNLGVNIKVLYKAATALEETNLLTFLGRDEAMFEVTPQGQAHAQKLSYLPPLLGPKH